MTERLSCRVPCARCDQLRRLRADLLCTDCGTASDKAQEADRRQDRHVAALASVERVAS